VTHPDYLEALRERYGPDAGTREPDPATEWAETYSPCGPGCVCADDYDPDAEFAPDADDEPGGEWYGTRPVEVVEIPGVS
jgi:hypothetical protein